MENKLKELENYAKENNIPIMEKEGIEFLTDYIKKHNIKNILEIGSAIGYSAIKMALINNSINVTTIERDKSRYEEAVKNINKFNLNNRINIINKDALDITLDNKYDLIFLDAAKGQYINFFNKFINNLNNNGVIITDDLLFHGMVEGNVITLNKNTRQLIRKIKKYIEFLKNNKEFNTKFYKIGDGISISKKVLIDKK
jgi:predicted O-methyltransferase YrrM